MHGKNNLQLQPRCISCGSGVVTLMDSIIIWKPHSFDKADMAKLASEAEEAELPRANASLFALGKKLLLFPPEVLRED